MRDLLRERDYLIKHTQIVKPLQFNIIVDQYSWKKSTLRLGLFLYYLLEGRIRISRYRKNRGKYPKSVDGYFEYMDAYTDDSRLVIYNIVSARRRKAVCLNYVEATGFSGTKGDLTVHLRDNEMSRDFDLKPKVIVNAGGPWAGTLMKTLGLEMDRPFRLSKGIHLVVPAEKIPVTEAIAFRTRVDRRQMFIIPRGEVVHIGTTDTFVDDPDDSGITEDDVSYIVKSVSSLFPNLSEDDVITAFSGLRPLFGEGDDPGKVSRDFEVLVNGNIVNVLGGKITNYRSAARKVAKRIAVVLGKDIRTSGLPTIGYSRPEQTNLIEYIINNECPLRLEDIMRRREAYRIYSIDGGASMEEEVRREMEKAGMVVK